MERKKDGQPGGEAEPRRVQRRSTAEQRREAVERYVASGLSQKAFAQQWGVNAVTFGAWLRRYEEAGPAGLDRVVPGPGRPRGKPPLPEPVKAEIAAVKRRFPDFGLRRVRDFLVRFSGLRVSTGSVRKVLRQEGLPQGRTPAKRRRRKAGPPQRFERAHPGELWQSDITYVDVPWSRKPLYLVAFLDDHSRFVVAHGLHATQRADIVLEALAQGISRYGRPKEVLTDQGRQYFAWRGKCDFQKRLAKEGIQHVVARAQHPQTVGKCERLWKTLQEELWSRVALRDLDDARERLRHWIDHYNFQRPHQGLGGLVPADRFFGAAAGVRDALERAIEKNALRLAIGETPRRPVFLVGQIDGQAVSLHGEGGRVVVHLPDGQTKEIETRDLGIAKEKTDENARKDGDEDRGDDAGGAAARGDGARGSPPAAPGAQAHVVPDAQDDAVAGAGAVAERVGGGAGAGAPDGRDDPSNVAREDEAGGRGAGAGALGRAALAAVPAGGVRDGGGVPAPAALPSEGGRDVAGADRGRRGGAAQEDRGAGA